MKHITLEEYLDKLVAYNNKYTDVSTRFKDHIAYTDNHELIKRTEYVNPKSRFQWKIFIRYMNNSYWLWE